MTEPEGLKMDNKNEIRRHQSAEEFLKECDSPWSGLARSRRLSVGTQETVSLLRTHTRQTFDKVSNIGIETALDSLDLKLKEVVDLNILNNDTASAQHTVKSLDSQDKLNVSTNKLDRDVQPRSRSSIKLGERLRKEIKESFDMMQNLPVVKHGIRKVTRLGLEKPRVVILKADGIGVYQVNTKASDDLKETTFVPYESVMEAMLIDHTTILIQVVNYHDLQWKSNLAPQIISDIAVRLEIVNLLSHKREQLHTIENVARHMFRWGVLDPKILEKSNIAVDNRDIFGVRKNLAIKKSYKNMDASELDDGNHGDSNNLKESRKDMRKDLKKKLGSFYFFRKRFKKTLRDKSTKKESINDKSGNAVAGNSIVEPTRSIPKPQLSITRRKSLHATANHNTSKKNHRKSMVERLVETIDDPFESKIRFYVQKLVFDQQTDEGRTRSHFIDNSKKMFEESRMAHAQAKNDVGSQPTNRSDLLLIPLRKTRQFIDGMREYIIKHHRQKLLALMESQPSFSPHDQKNLSSQVMKEENHLCTDIPEVNIRNSDGNEKIGKEEINESRLENIVTKCAEQSMVQKLFPLILKNIDDVVTKAQTAKWLECYAKLSAKPQKFYQIPDDHRCNVDWHEAVQACTDIGESKTASEKMEALLDTARLIYERFHELKPGCILGADDFMPIFMFVVSRASLDRAFHDKEYLVHLCPENILDGQGAYYLSTFEAALTFMMNMDLS